MKNLSFLFCILLFTIQCKQSSQDLTITDKGLSKYRIIFTSGILSDSLDLAIASFKNNLKIITGVDIPAFADIVGEEEPEILIGKSKRTAKYDSDIPYKSLGGDGYYTATKGQKWIITGNSASAIVAGLNDICNKLGSVKLNETLTQYSQNKSLKILSDPGTVTIPSFTYRQVINPYALNADYRAWNRINVDNEKDWGTWGYSMERIFPAESYFKTHPEYYAHINGSPSPNQINFSDTATAVALDKNLAVWTLSKGRAKYWSVSPYGNNIVSEDSKTQAIIKETGSPAGAVISMANKSAIKNKERIYTVWLDGAYRKACTTIPIEKNVMLVLDTKDTDHGTSLGDGAINEAFRKDLADWKKITSNIMVMMHVTNEENYLMPFPNLHALQRSLQYLHDQGVKDVIFGGDSGAGTSFADLKFYVASNLAWNVNQNVDTLIWRFCDNTYGKAANTMYGYVQAMEKTIQDSKSKLALDATPSSAFRSWLTPAIINQLYTYFNAVIPLAQNNSELKAITDRDRLSMIYTQLEVAKSMGTKTFGYFMNLGALRSQLVKADQPTGKAVQETDLGTKKAEWKPIQGMKDLLTQFVNDCVKSGIKSIDSKGTTPEQYRDLSLKFIDQKVQTHLAFKAGTFSFNASPDPLFADGDPSTLNDGLNGLQETPKTNWLALKGGDGEVTWDLGRDTLISSMDIRFLQNIPVRAWAPTSVTVLVSTDGKTFTEIKKSNISATNPIQVVSQNISFGKKSIRAIKIKTNSKATCPADHIDSGDAAVVLIDEIVIH